MREVGIGGSRWEGGEGIAPRNTDGARGRTCGREDTEGLSAAECLPPCGIEPRTLRLCLRLFLGSKQGVPRPPPYFLCLPLFLAPSRPSLSLSFSLSLSLTELHSSKLRAYIYIYIYARVYVRTRFAGIERGRNPSFPHGCGGTVVAGGKRTNTQTDAQRRREIPLRNSPSLSARIYPSLSLSLFSSLSLSVRTSTRPLGYIRTRRAGRNLSPWKTTQRHRQSAFRRAIGPRRHSETQW